MKFASKWMELEKIMSEETQTQKDKCGMYSLISHICHKVKDDHATIQSKDSMNLVMWKFQEGEHMNHTMKGK